MSNKPVIFDIETGPLPSEQLRVIMPAFDPVSIRHPGEFDQAAVKVSHLKDPAKITAKIEAEKQKHADAVASFTTDLAAAEANYWREVESKAALSALTGEVLAIGYKGQKTVLDYVGEASTEASLLTKFWSQYRNLRKDGRRMIGYNIAFFDIPFLVQRSWIAGVTVPDTIYAGPGRYLEPTFIDLAQAWSGSARNGFVKLDTIAKAFGIPGKPDGINGGDFARLFHNPDTRQVALDYLEGDLDMTFTVAERVGLA